MSGLRLKPRKQSELSLSPAAADATAERLASFEESFTEAIRNPYFWNTELVQSLEADVKELQADAMELRTAVVRSESAMAVEISNLREENMLLRRGMESMESAFGRLLGQFEDMRRELDALSSAREITLETSPPAKEMQAPEEPRGIRTQRASTERRPSRHAVAKRTTAAELADILGEIAVFDQRRSHLGATSAAPVAEALAAPAPASQGALTDGVPMRALPAVPAPRTELASGTPGEHEPLPTAQELRRSVVVSAAQEQTSFVLHQAARAEQQSTVVSICVRTG
eukprot:Amastigsp_a508995_18.p1 type:complete len:285 gc:universal Amastigsp_a508995_18:51-905(+)